MAVLPQRSQKAKGAEKSDEAALEPLVRAERTGIGQGDSFKGKTSGFTPEQKRRKKYIRSKSAELSCLFRTEMPVTPRRMTAEPSILLRT